MGSWTPDELSTFATADDFRVAPFREDGKTSGTPTFIWSVVAEDELYIRPYHGTRSRWYRAALAQGAGQIHLAGRDRDVTFAPAEAGVLDAVDAAYRAKYGTSSYLAPMIADGPRSTTVRVIPRT